MSSLVTESDLLISSGDYYGDYESSGSSFSTTDLIFCNETIKCWISNNSMLLPRNGSLVCGCVSVLSMAWSKFLEMTEEFKIPWIISEAVNLSSNATKIVEIAPNRSEISFPYDQGLTKYLLYAFFTMICILGLLGNGRTIYLLAFSIKRNPFTTFILNLSVADFGVLTSFIMAETFATVSTLGKIHNIGDNFFFLFFELFSFTYSSSQFLLTAISLERCVAVLFPLWHRCHRPPYLPILVCGLIWILSFLLSAVHFILYYTKSSGNARFLYQLIVNGLLCTPLMVVSTVTLLIHTRSKIQRNQRKLLTTILLALLFFLLLSLPINVFHAVEYFGSYNPFLMTIGLGCAALNSSINPLLYFLVGRKKKGKDQPRASFKVALQRVFKDEQDSSKEQQTTEESIL